MQQSLPATLGDAIATEPFWLQSWVMLLVLTHVAAVLFIAGRHGGRWFVRYESVGILVSFLLAAVAMNWLYDQVGYVRLLGLPHLIFWTPVWLWVAFRVRTLGLTSVYDKYLGFYLVVAGASLVIDAVDVLRFIVGDGDLL